METWRIRACALLAASCLAFLPSLAAATDVAPGLDDDAASLEANEQLAALLGSLPEGDQQRVRGIYVAIDPNRGDVLALPACDDDGDYVIVLSRAILDLVDGAAYASASDSLLGTHLVMEYAALLARSQMLGTPPLPPPAPLHVATVRHASLEEETHAFAQDALAWLVASELAHAIAGDVVCPNPTVTHERGDDVWTREEHAEAARLGPARVVRVAERDVWAASIVLARGLDLSPARTLLTILAPFEEARPPGGAWSYLALHPGTRSRALRLELATTSRRAETCAACETSAGRVRMR